MNAEQEAIAARKSSFEKFYQINKRKAEYLTYCLDENPTALKILLFIFSNMDGYNAVTCSYKVLEEALGLSKSTLIRAVRFLRQHGFIYVYKSGSANVYVANSDLAWSSWGNNRKYCKFPTNIILSKAEQKKRANMSALDIHE